MLKRVFHKILNGGKFFQTDISSPNGNFVEHTCPHICAKFEVIWSYGVCCTAEKPVGGASERFRM